MTNLDPGWTTHKRAKFDTGAEDRNSEGDNVPLPGVTYLSDLLKGIDVKRQTGYTDEDLPKPFKMAKSYAHVPHEYLAPDGFPKSEFWLNPACKFAVLSKDNKDEGKGGVVRRALDMYRAQKMEDVPPNPPLHPEKTRRNQRTRHPERARKNFASKATDQSSQSANRKNKTYDGQRYRLNDPLLPYENYERTMEIINNCYKIITHGKGQYVDRDSNELIFTYSFEDLESMTPDERNEHQSDVRTILMSTKLFKRLPTPKPLTPPSCGNILPTRPIVIPPIPHNVLNTEPSSKTVLPYKSDKEDIEDPQSNSNLVQSSSPLTPLPTSDEEDGAMTISKTRKVPILSNGTKKDSNEEPVSSSKKRKRTMMNTDTNGDPTLLSKKRKRTVTTNGNPTLLSKKRKRTVTTNGALIHGRMYCFGQTVGYSSNILISPYTPIKGSSLSLYKEFLDKLPDFGARIGGRFKGFCDEGFRVARQQLNQLHAPPMTSTSKYQPAGPHDFAANFAFTLGNFYNKPHTDNDKGQVYCLWYPIDGISGRILTQSEGYVLEGGWFIFPEFRVAINFGGKSAVQIAWNGKSTFHHTIPSKERIELNEQGEKVHYTRLGCSSQITYRMARASVKIGTLEQYNHTSNCEREVRDVEDLLKQPDRKWKK